LRYGRYAHLDESTTDHPHYLVKTSQAQNLLNSPTGVPTTAAFATLCVDVLDDHVGDGDGDGDGIHGGDDDVVVVTYDD
jgi:hypothetical protein